MTMDDLEQSWVTFCTPNVRDMKFPLVYRPPGRTLEKSIDQFRESIEHVTSENSSENTIIGDLNINYKLIHSYPYKLLKNVECVECEFGLRQVLHFDTQITAQSFTLIDLTTDCQYIASCGILELCISDHYAVYMVKKKPRLKQIYQRWKYGQKLQNL